MTDRGPNWNIITTRPGISPLGNLAKAILETDSEYVNSTEEEKLINKTITTSILKGGNHGLVDLAKRYKLVTGDNLLLIIDQFEELFRYKSDLSISESAGEAAEFVSLLLEAIKHPDAPIYIALSMRSDYIGDCASFPGLTEQINESNYLVPQMTRDQKRFAIEGPVSVGGGKISNRLVKKLLADVGDNQDQLPILQHALMRSWNYWAENKEPGEPIDIRHHNAVGRISEALSQHANEAFEELDTRERGIAEILFKTITEKGNNQYGVRKPTRIKVISEICGVDNQAVIDVIEKFREPGRSLLMPAANVPLTGDTLVEVSHESLIRIWTRLKNWVEEEDESAQMYMRLSEAASMYQIGRTGLWRPPDLQLALNWQKKQNPTRVWAQRYDEAFERAIVFLDTSRITYEAEQKNQEMQQKRLLKRTRAVAVILAIAAVIAIIFFIFGITQQIEAEQQKQLAEQRADEATAASALAAQRAIEAENAQKIAEDRTEEARLARAEALRNLNRAQEQQLIAEQQTLIAQQQTEIADDARLIAESATQLAQQKAEEASRNFQQAQRLLFLSIAQSMSVKALQIGDNNLKGLLAQQAFMFNYQYDGKEYDNYIYEGVYNSMSQLMGESYNSFSGHKDAVRSVVFARDGTNFFSAGSDGKILMWNKEDNQSLPSQLTQNDFPNRILKTSLDGKWLANASDSTYVQLFDLNNLGSGPSKILGHTGFIYDIEFMPDNSGFYTVADDQTMRFYDFNRSRIVKNLPEKIKSVSISPDGSTIAAGGLGGNVYLMDAETLTEKIILENPGNFIHSVKFSNDGQLLAIGDEVGLVRVYNLEDGTYFEDLIGATARINDIEFSIDDKLLAAASWDGTIRMWVMDNLDDLPIVMSDAGGHVWDISFSEDGEYLISGTGKNEVKLWPTNPKTIADKICEILSRNMTQKEWERYVGNGVDFRITCSTLALNEK